MLDVILSWITKKKTVSSWVLTHPSSIDWRASSLRFNDFKIVQKHPQHKTAVAKRIHIYVYIYMSMYIICKLQISNWMKIFLFNQRASLHRSPLYNLYRGQISLLLVQNILQNIFAPKILGTIRSLHCSISIISPCVATSIKPPGPLEQATW